MAVKNSSLKKFGANVRQHRESLNLSQEQLADGAGIHRTFISGIERGVRNPGLLGVMRIATALGTTASKLLEGLEE